MRTIFVSLVCCILFVFLFSLSGCADGRGDIPPSDPYSNSWDFSQSGDITTFRCQIRTCGNIGTCADPFGPQNQNDPLNNFQLFPHTSVEIFLNTNPGMGSTIYITERRSLNSGSTFSTQNWEGTLSDDGNEGARIDNNVTSSAIFIPKIINANEGFNVIDVAQLNVYSDTWYRCLSDKDVNF